MMYFADSDRSIDMSDDDVIGHMYTTSPLPNYVQNKANKVCIDHEVRNVKRWKDLWTARAVSRVMFISTLPSNPTHYTLQFIVVGWSSVMYHPTTT